MANLFVTADRIGGWEGGANVCHHESTALARLGPCEVWGRDRLCYPPQFYEDSSEPWRCDGWCSYNFQTVRFDVAELAHFYAGTFGKTAAYLKQNGCKVTYTVAAHDRAISRQEHLKLGLTFPYPHLVEEGLWQRYIEGYRQADVIICPSSMAAKTVRAYGPDFAQKRIEIIPHGCDIPTAPIRPLPKMFTVGYLGSYGADKGVVYLLQAWKQLAYKDAVLVLAGRDSTSSWVQQLAAQYGGGNIIFQGFVKDVADFYNEISLYCQPSATEGFGIEVLEALSYGRMVVCSDGAGAVDVIRQYGDRGICDAMSVDDIANNIDYARQNWNIASRGKDCREIASLYSWDKIEEMYVKLWKGLI